MKKICYTLLSACSWLAACEETDRLPYSTDPAVYFNEQLQSGANIIDLTSNAYSFADKASTLQVDTFHIKTKIMGNTSAQDRRFKAVVVSDSSALAVLRDTVYYQVLDGVVKAGEVDGYVPLVLYRNPLLKNNTLQVTLKIIDDPAYDLRAGTAGILAFTVYWGDRLVKPANWDSSLSYFFGTYSNTKYQFIIDVLGISTFTIYSRFEPNGQYSSANMFDFGVHMRQALRDYNLANDPDMTDENGNLVIFP